MGTSIILSFLLILIGIGLRYLIGKRRFDRRNYAGIESFRSYNRFVLTRLIENLINTTGLLTVIAGIVLLLIVLYGRYG